MLKRAPLPLFGALAILHTWPMFPRAASAVADSSDGLLNAWLLAAVTRSFVAHPLNVFDINTYYPFRMALAALDHQVSAVLIAGPLYLLTGSPLVAVNLYTIATFALGGIFMARLVRELTDSVPAGLIAGCLFAFSPARYENVNHSHVLGSFWLPLMLLALHRYLGGPTWGRLWGLLASALLCALSAWYYAVIAPLALLVAGAADLIRLPDHRAVALRRAAVAALVAAAVLAAAALPYVRVGREFRPDARFVSDVTGEGPAEPPAVDDRHMDASVIQDNSENLEGFVAVAGGNRVPWLRAARGVSRPGTRLFPGVAGALLAAVAILFLVREQMRVSRLALVGPAMAALLILAAMPAVRWAAPGIADATRVPGFLGVLVASFAVWMMVRPREGAQWTGRARIYLILAIVGAAMSLGPTVFAGQTALASGIYPAHLPPFNLLRASARFGVLYVLGIAVLAAYGYVLITQRLGPRTRIMAAAATLVLVNVELFAAPLALQRVPRVPEVYTWIARAPAGAVVEFPIHDNVWSLYWSLFHRQPLVNGYGLVAPPAYARLADPDDLSPEMIEELRATFHARYVVINTAMYDGAAAARLAGNLARSAELLRPVEDLGRRRVFEITGPSRGAPVRRSYRPWMLKGRHAIAVKAELDGARAGSISRIEVWGNGALLTAVPAEAGLRPGLLATLPREAANGLEVQVLGNYRLSNPGAPIGRTMTAAPADIAATASLRATRLQVNGHIWVGRKGYNLATIAPDGEVAGVRVFNTSWHESESHAMAAYIRSVPSGWTVVAATNYDASRALTADAVEALRTLGMTVDLRGRFSAAHAAIGVKGGAPGTALEQTGRLDASCTVGAPVVLPVTVRDVRVY